MANPILEHLRLSGTTYDLVDSTAIHSLDGYWDSATTQNAITAATGALAETIDQELSGKADTTAVTQEISAAVSGKADTTAVTQAISEAVSGKANVEDVITDVAGDTIQSEASNPIQVRISKTKNGQSSTSSIAKFKASAFTYDGNEIGINTTNIAVKSDIPSVTSYADAVAYDANSKYMKFYHGGTGGTEVYSFDASPFLIDGMVDNVEIKDVTISGESVTCLVISFNTAAGKQDINIPISEIFDASNYYTKAETDDEIDAKIAAASGVTTGQVETMIEQAVSGKADTTAVTQSISEATSGKADTTAVTQINDALTAHTSDSSIHVPASEISTALDGKQDALVSGTNIKTINGSSILGSGDMTVDAGLHAEVQGTTLIFS
mgnify:CR=1 FL=1